MNATEKSGRTQLVVFRVGDDRFAAEGVIDYGGRVVPVIDLRMRFELPAASSRESARILVVVAGDEWIAAIVDGVDEVITVTAAQLEPPPPLFKGLAKQYLRALVRRSDHVIVALDVAQLLTAREQVILEQVVAGAAHV